MQQKGGIGSRGENGVWGGNVYVISHGMRLLSTITFNHKLITITAHSYRHETQVDVVDS